MVRSNVITRLFALVTSIVFFNMGMILMEVSALRLDKDRAMAENLARQIAGCSSEEETDAMTGHADEDTSVKEIDLMATNLLSILMSELSDSRQLKQFEHLGTPRYGNYEIFCPPPEA
ncbi:MAG TPA: hypothetical protein VK658_13010 [Chryseolinea sp.]|nr:hypothetical protein [Chryseolinea sp.]